jgi:tRNA U34 5-carboxymethylaminomethyl modifying enzyme MnmG/GidA
LLAKIDEETERATFEEQRLTERADKADRRLVEHDEQFAILNQTLAEEVERAESAEKELSEALADEQKRIDDNEDKWSRDQDTQYTFNIDGPALTITETTYVNGEGEAKAPISFMTISEQ